MDKLQWFKFSYADWRMGKIQRCPEITQARFVNLCCLYWSKDCFLSYDDAEIEIDKEHLDILINKKIITNANNFISISFLDEQFAEIDETNKNRSKSGVLGNLKRWHKDIYKKYESREITLKEAISLSKNIAHQSHPDNTPIAPQSQNIADKRREEERREEERREEETIEDERHFSIIDLANKYKSNDRIIKAVLNNGLKLASNKEDLLTKVDDFVLHLETTGETTKQKKDFNSHFLNWIKIQKKHEPLDTTNETLIERAARKMKEEMNR